MSADFERTGCGMVDRYLDVYLSGRLPNAAARSLERHVADCQRCRQLIAIVGGSETMGANEADAAGDADVLSDVLRRTTGSPCARAEALLPVYADGELDEDSRDILQAHVAHCDGCSRLLAALQDAEQVLPSLAELEPPLGFTARVLRATTAAPPPVFGTAAWKWTLRVLARPRASLELAYVAAVLLVVLLGNPVTAFYQAEQHASALAGTVRVTRLAGEIEARDAATGALARLVAAVRPVIDAIQSDIAGRLNQARTIAQAVERAVRDAIAWMTSIDLKALLGRDRTTQPPGQPAQAPQPRVETEPGGRR